ncbi:MAG: nickel-dependent lactate racemase [Thermoplasmata archaeon]|nr:nickel-dependent lactate racemase [Thermoplasmata archaeon]
MRIEIPYGDGTEAVEVRDENLGEIIHPKDLPAMDEERILSEAISVPTGGPTLQDFLKNAKDVVVIVNDATRPTPTGKVIRSISQLLAGLDVKYVVATGMHREPTESEYEFIFGDMYAELKGRIFAHDSKKSETIHLGTSKNGTPLKINRMVVDADRIIVISSVEPHYFAGYTGGRKSFLPGVAAYETIEANHKLALKIEAQALRLKGNPVHEDMEEVLKALKDKRIFSIMTVLDKAHRICSASAGDIKRSFRTAAKKADDVFVVKLKKKADVVVAVTAFPYDIDLYQSQKALDNAKYAVRDGGIIVLVSACRTGVGPDTFLNLLASANSPKDVLDKISHTYKLGYHKAGKMAEIGLKGKMFAVTKLPPEIALKAHMVPKNSVQEAVDSAISELGPRSRVTFMMDAVITVPKV